MIGLVLFTTISIIISTILTFGTYRTFIVQTSPKQASFLQGKIPLKAPDGVYKGSVGALKTSWVGKEFNAKDSSGINNFKSNGQISKNYPFKTYTGQGIQDKNKEVLKIDYNLPTNPIWLRFILDEIVEVKPNTFLGKLHIKLFPGVAFSLGYFSLEK